MTDTQVAAIEQLATTYDFGHGVRHSRKVATLSTSLFDQLSFHGLIPALMPEDRRLLFATALAHDIGASPRVLDVVPATDQAHLATHEENHRILSCLVLRRALDDPYLPRLRDITERDWNALLYCVLWHEGDPNTQLAGTPPAELWRLRPLAGILRLSDALDHTRRNVVTDVRVMHAPLWVRILVKPSRPCDEEVAAAQRNSTILAEALGLRIAVQQIIEEGASTDDT